MATMARSANKLRDQEELEGTILLPEARPVRNNSSGATSTTPVVAATAVPTTYFEYSAGGGGDTIEEETEHLVPPRQEEAPVIPSYDGNLHNSARDRRDVTVGERKGRIDNERQKEDIQRANREAHSIDYFARKQVEEANRLAQISKHKEDKGLVQTTTQLSREEKHCPPPAAKVETEHYAGTYGKDYEVAKYETKEYKTAEYDVSEYKSIYDS